MQLNEIYAPIQQDLAIVEDRIRQIYRFRGTSLVGGFAGPCAERRR